MVIDVCKEFGVGVPKATLVYKRLREHSIDLRSVPLTGDELAELVQEATSQ